MLVLKNALMPVKVALTVLILSFTFSDFLFGQTNSAPEEVFNKAVSEYDRGHYDTAFQLFESLTDEHCSNMSYNELCLESLIYKANVHRNKSQFEKAKKLIDRSEAFVLNELNSHPDHLVHVYQMQIFAMSEVSTDESAEIYSIKLRNMLEEEDLKPLSVLRAAVGIGYYEDHAGNYQKAIDIYYTGLSAIEGVERERELQRTLIMVYTNLGVFYRKLGKPEKAMKNYLLSVDEINELHGESHLSLAYSYNNIGGIYYGMGDFGLASDYFIRAASIMERRLGSDHHRLGVAYNNAGVSKFMLGDLDKAAEYLEEAQRVKEATMGENHIDTAVGYSNLASIYAANEQFDEAERNYLLSIEVRKNDRGENHPILIEPKTQLAAFYLDRNRFEEAEYTLHRALEIAINRLGPSHPNVADLYFTLGNSRMLQEHYDEAIDYFSKSFETVYGEYDFSEKIDLTHPIGDPPKTVEILQHWAQTHWTLYELNAEEFHLNKTKSILNWSLELVGHLQNTYKAEASKLSLIDRNYSLYTKKAEVLNSFYDVSGDEKYLDRLFTIVEESRSRIALELLQNLEARSFAGVPEEIIEEERSLNSKISGLFQRLSTEQSKGPDKDRVLAASLQDSLFYAKRDLEQFTAELENNYPSYYWLKYDNQVINKREASALLGHDKTLISFVVGDEYIYAFIMSPSHTKFVKLTQTDGIEEKVTELRDAVTGGKTSEFKSSSYKLYSRLIKPLRPYFETNSLIIVADQVLHFLPFELLLTEKTEHTRYDQMPYLVRELSISYASSVTILERMLSRKKENPRNLLALAPFADSDQSWTSETDQLRYGNRLDPLLLTSYETRKIGEIFSQRRGLSEFFFPNRTEILLSSDATKSELINRLGNYNYLHFATHAFINEENPSMSGIALYPGADDDGMAYVDDIYNMELNADLVVLGACDTGLGSVYRGEGMIGFTRAFIYAGAANLAVSMWRVNDQPTAQLMIYFYENIREGYSYSESLRLAKLSMIENPTTAAPRNWAAFVLHGL